METIEQAATEYAQKERETRSEHTAFCVGAQFAQRWIPVTEELPELDTEVIVKIYYVSTRQTEYQNGHRKITHWDEWKWTSETDRLLCMKPITHWRHI
jgi:hypothetical protein